LIGILEMAKRQNLPFAPIFDTGLALIIGYAIIIGITLIIVLITRHQTQKKTRKRNPTIEYKKIH